MSSNTTQKKQTISGTQSPPLEATGSAKPMGVSCIQGIQQADWVPDKEQRKEYFGSSDEPQSKKEQRAGPGEAQSRKVGQSLVEKNEERV